MKADHLCGCKHENVESVCALELGLDPFGPCRKHAGATERIEVTQMQDERPRYMPYHPPADALPWAQGAVSYPSDHERDKNRLLLLRLQG